MRGLAVSLSVLLAVTAGIVVHSIVLKGQMDDFIALTDQAHEAAQAGDFATSSAKAQEILELLSRRQAYLCATVDYGIIQECEVMAERARVCLDIESKSNLLMDLAELRRLFKTIQTSENFSFDNIF